MKKIPTIFERDWAGDKSRVVGKVVPGCEWVFAGEGVATRKMDGTSCLIEGNRFMKRREVGRGDPIPEGFRISTQDEETGKTIGWIPVGDGPEDRWHREAFNDPQSWDGLVAARADGTYELLGPKVQGNPENFHRHVLMPHSEAEVLADCPRSFDELRTWLTGRNIEGVVFHHPDGRMAKIKLRDFGIKRGGGA